MPRQRKLNSAEKEEAKVMLQMKVNKKLLQQHLSSSSGKTVTLRDLTNVQAELNATNTGNNLDALVMCLRELEGIYIYNSFLVIIYSGKCRGELITYVRSLLNIFPLLNFSCNV